MTRRSVACVVVVSLLLILSLSPVALGAERVLRVTMMDFFEPGPREALTEIIAPRFEELHPGVKVELEWISWTGYVDAMVVRHAAGTQADVIYMGSSVLAQFKEAGLIQSIDQWVRGWEDLDDFYPPAIDDVTIDGEFWALPARLDVRTLVYDRDYFAEAGLDPDVPPTTWEETRQFARRLTKYDSEGNITRQGFDPRPDFTYLLSWLYQAGGGYVSDDGVALVGTEESIEAMEFIHSLIWEDRVALPTNASWRRKDLAMNIDNPWLMAFDREELDVGVALPLKYRTQETNVHINKMGVSSLSQHPELAVEFIKFVLLPENYSLISQENTRVGPRISLVNYSPYNEDHRWQTWFQVTMLSRPLPSHVIELSEVAGKFNATARRIFNNEVPVRTAMMELANDLNNNVLGKSKQ